MSIGQESLIDQESLEKVCPRKLQQEKAIRIIVELRQDNYTIKEICAYLKEKGYKSSHNTPFSPTWIWNELKMCRVRKPISG